MKLLELLFLSSSLVIVGIFHAYHLLYLQEVKKIKKQLSISLPYPVWLIIHIQIYGSFILFVYLVILLLQTL